MKAIMYASYGSPDVLAMQEMDKTTPKNNEVLIKIQATTVTSGDRRVRSLDMPVGFGLIARLVFGVLRPRQPTQQRVAKRTRTPAAGISWTTSHASDSLGVHDQQQKSHRRPATERAEDLRFLAKLAEAREFRPVIDRRYPFEKIAEAHRYVDSGRKKGNVVITVGHND